MQSQKYLNLLTQLKACSYKNKSQSLCCFTAQKGGNYNNNLMVVGRAVNGWGNEFDLHSLDAELMTKSLFKQSKSSGCPMKWVEESWGNKEGYNTNSSAFWRVTRKISERLNKSSQNEAWASEIVWSNLYKIAPSNGGNPNNSLCDKQFIACNELLLTEIEEYCPKVIVFFTGLNWFNGFLSGSVSLSSNKEYRWVEAYGSLRLNNKEIRIIISKHPQGKPEVEVVNEIMSLMLLT